jgi:hypothetical protein
MLLLLLLLLLPSLWVLGFRQRAHSRTRWFRGEFVGCMHRCWSADGVLYGGTPSPMSENCYDSRGYAKHSPQEYRIHMTLWDMASSSKALLGSHPCSAASLQTSRMPTGVAAAER